MKALWILYDIVLDETILEILDDLKITGFTRWPRLTGHGPKNTRMDNNVWPGANAAIMTVQNDDLIGVAMRRLQALRDDEESRGGIWAFTAPVSDMLA
ncbi:MAG: PG0541 family transporter-associated protein [Kiritimatiellia bacterium]|jgi:hypothetical protein